ncbi:GNAT family N-acetyltransferase [Mesorhizobium sp. CAU 1732]|uniref:GNAT family N-acetyltransferase n=1 Tax=Mesorhizobium sp. CAU 1732 TaxID=3140358 RepID=UPI003260E7CF
MNFQGRPSRIPVLETERLILREHRTEDLADYTCLWSQDDVVRFISGKPLDRQDCWGRIMRFRGMWEIIGYGFWIIEDRQTGRLIGEAGLMDVKRVIEPSLDGTSEAGWALLPSAQGKGLAGEAMRAALDWADRNHYETPQSCVIDARNTASMRLASRLGFRETARGNFRDAALVHYRRLAGE